MTTELPDFYVLMGRTLVSAALVLLYGYDFLRVVDAWRDVKERRRRSGQFRAVIKSSVLMLGLFIIFVNAINATFFSQNETVRDALRFLTYILLGTLLVGGVALVSSWQREEPE